MLLVCDCFVGILAHLAEVCCLNCYLRVMSLTAAGLDTQYGPLLRQPPLSECTSYRYLHRALQAKNISVTEGVVRQWITRIMLYYGFLSIT